MTKLKSKIEILDEKLPNFFYKYVWADNVIKILESKRLWFSSPQDFNDPFDCNVNLIDFTPSNENIEKFINEKVSKNRSVALSYVPEIMAFYFSPHPPRFDCIELRGIPLWS